jgi:hypothetical protein
MGRNILPGVEDLLRRLAQGQACRQKVVHSLLFGSRTMVTTCVICFICVPGCAIAAMFLMQSGDFHPVPVQTEQASARADRLPVLQPVHSFGEARPVAFREIGDSSDLFEHAALRGSIRNALTETPPSSPLASSPIAPSPPAANTRKSRRIASRAAPTKPAVESPQPPPSPSLFEKLFGVILSASQIQRQT